jgi:hypothetical protein
MEPLRAPFVLCALPSCRSLGVGVMRWEMVSVRSSRCASVQLADVGHLLFAQSKLNMVVTCCGTRRCCWVWVGRTASMRCTEEIPEVSFASPEQVQHQRPIEIQLTAMTNRSEVCSLVSNLRHAHVAHVRRGNNHGSSPCLGSDHILRLAMKHPSQSRRDTPL